MVFSYPFQEAAGIDTYSDTDWSGCVKTRKSTNGGCLLLGSHFIKSWSSTQGPISLSSGEAEFYGVVKAAGVALGYQALMRDLGVEMALRVWTDSSATMGICSRQGLGKLRHVDTRSLWVQQRVRDGSFELRKVRGELNPADLFTKHLSSEERVISLLKLFGCRYEGGRASGAPRLREAPGALEECILAADMMYDPIGTTIEVDGFTYPAVKVDGLLVAEAYLLNAAILPRQVQGDLSLLFPRAQVADAFPEEEELEDVLEQFGRRRGADIGSAVPLTVQPKSSSEEAAVQSGIPGAALPQERNHLLTVITLRRDG